MLVGRQKPTFSTVGKFAISTGDLVAELFETEAGATFYEAQKTELCWFTAKNADGSPAATTIAISKPRQNGKSYAARFYAAYAADFEHKRVLYSAHHAKTVNKMFQELTAIYENRERYPQFYENVKRISHSKGYEGIYFKDWRDADGILHEGGCIEFQTRTNSAARGGTYSVIIIDEAQELTDEQQDAMLPVVSAAAEVDDIKNRPQIIMIGTPTPPTSPGTVFKRMHDTAHREKVRGIWWIEWAYEVDDIENADITEKTVLKIARTTNPAFGYRISAETVLNEFRSMSKDGFAHERLGWWSKEEKKQDFAIDLQKWASCVSDEMKPNGKTAFGVKFSADGATVALCGAVCPSDGTKARISLIEYANTGAGVQWLADWLAKRKATTACVVIDGKNNVDLLIDKISSSYKIKGAIIKPSAKDVIAASSMLINEINEETVTWYRGQELLNESATTSTKRHISGGFGFGGDLAAPIEAAALALWGCRTTKREPGKKMRVG